MISCRKIQVYCDCRGLEKWRHSIWHREVQMWSDGGKGLALETSWLKQITHCQLNKGRVGDGKKMYLGVTEN